MIIHLFKHLTIFSGYILTFLFFILACEISLGSEGGRGDGRQ